MNSVKMASVLLFKSIASVIAVSPRLAIAIATLASSATLAWPAAAASETAVNGKVLHVATDYIRADISLEHPGFAALSLDSLGKEHFPPVIFHQSTTQSLTSGVPHGNRVDYHRLDSHVSRLASWSLEVASDTIYLTSRWSAGDPPAPMVLDMDNQVCHVTLLGLMLPDGSIQLPAIMHFPDQGSFRISVIRGKIPSLGYSVGQGDLGEHQARSVQVTFPAATEANPVVAYKWKVVAIHPKIPGIESDARFDGFRRNWLDIFQLSPRWQMLANHAASDTCAFCYYEYADIARVTPELAGGFNALDMVRQTLDKIIAGANAYGMPGHGSFPEYSADTLPSLLIAAEDYVEGSGDRKWLKSNYATLKSWADKMVATDKNGDGLIKYSLSGNSGSWPRKLKYRPANWWDTIGFGYEDAYANALAYRALRGMENLAAEYHQKADQDRYHQLGDKLKSAYCEAFYDSKTGVLAGWRSEDGQLHDYYFLWVNGIAIHYGLVPRDRANSIMDHLLAKMKEVGYGRFDLGLPGNLVPVARKDYVDLNPRFGGGTNEANNDGFEIYENGGATACYAYYTLAALYDLGRSNEGDSILFPLLDSFAKGNFQGRCSNGMSKDWKSWSGACWGYEGFLTDNYYALLAVMDRNSQSRDKPVEQH
jgi:hypothetical protein